ncbi:hypothetical protein L596_012097 [Steinernema carpocapsae]|uniref:Cullin family profile domain-containing protein n=1 Tax=Steinernema carpocapsae TaxID=34508 RepID=A0A4V6A4P9_STECR|nr:hypothetical protein L596_012097 [Steinernema carpocapsae]
MESMNFKTEWEQIEVGLDKILYHKNLSIQEYMAMYSKVYAFVKDTNKDEEPSADEIIGEGNGRIVYKALEACLKNFLRDSFQKIHDIREEDSQLRSYANLWRNFEFSSKVTDGLFRYLNRHWISRMIEEQKEVGEIFEVQTFCMVAWKQVLFGEREDGRKLDIAKISMELLNRDRDSEQGVDLDLLRQVANSCVAMGVEYKKEETILIQSAFGQESDEDENGIKLSEREQLKTYEEHFERPLLEWTYDYYRKESTTLRAEFKIVDYMKRTKARIEEEVERSSRFFYHKLTNKRIQAKVEEAFIVDHLDLFKSEFMKLLKTEGYEELNMMYDLCVIVSKANEELKNYFCEYVTEKGLEAMAQIPETQQNDPKIYVTVVLKFYSDYYDVVDRAFKSDNGFRSFFEKACRHVVNNNCITKKFPRFSKSAELLARYVDMMLRKGGNKDNEDIETVFDRVMSVFVLIEDKDNYQKYYNKFLARRLLADLSVNDDSENGMISRMKQACGHDYTHVAVKMYTDIEGSKQLTSAFKEKPRDPSTSTSKSSAPFRGQ